MLFQVFDPKPGAQKFLVARFLIISIYIHKSKYQKNLEFREHQVFPLVKCGRFLLSTQVCWCLKRSSLNTAVTVDGNSFVGPTG